MSWSVGIVPIGGAPCYAITGGKQVSNPKLHNNSDGVTQEGKNRCLLVIPLGYSLQWCHISIHTEDTITDNQFTVVCAFTVTKLMLKI